MKSTLNFPFYAKYAFIVIGGVATVFILFIGQQIILPLIYATIIAILLNPLVNFLTKHRLNRIFAIFISVFVTILFTIGLIWFLSVQISLLSETYPQLKVKFNQTSVQLIHWISEKFNIRTYKIHAWINATNEDIVRNLGGSIGQTVSTINSVIIIVVLLPVYLFMILYYKNLLLQFVNKLFKSSQQPEVYEVLINSKNIIQSYLSGLLIEAAIIAVLNSTGLLILGIDYAIILGVTGALLNVIPYVGGVIAIALPMIIAFITKDSITAPLMVMGVYLAIQFIDNHFIIPSIVAAKVKINALVSVVVVLVGAALWGIPGMFLSIPLTAILKLIFDHIEPLKPWGFLLGNVVPTSKLNFGFIKK
ncbi:MAG: AI-2E family transporter [Bacteroidetes bacterium]|nr:AI-2E family transporter [Bacteroidota bacterium]MBL0064695.1 AI-2E family transporter [Bacteroidota bacterium]MBL0137346.1 AI-2E family transporter [Bacteroidota bacterium]